MLIYARKIGLKEYNQKCYMLRARAFKAYKDGRWKPHDLYENNRWKMLNGNTCWYCGKTFDDKNKLTLDHVFPRSKGGDSSMDNLMPVCRKCNSSKGDKDVLQWFIERNLFPPIPIIAHYFKQLYLYAISHDLMDKRYEELKAMSLPFNIDYIISKFPPPSFFLGDVDEDNCGHE